MPSQRSLIREASNELDSRILGHQYYEPELVGDDIEDTAQLPETMRLLMFVGMVNSMVIQPAFRFIKRGS